ncbi:hypothetical protein K525DRAFT_275667 [Schizophyllum commune Loenen D]|nr:hypothetical protein K525DRAFT_275667 [Schizophyllum commune Loenen D]
MNAAGGPRDDVSLDRVKHGQTDAITSHTSHTTGLLRLLSRFQAVLTRSPHSTSCPTLFIHV